MRKPNIKLLLVLPLLALLFSISTANAQALYSPLATEDFNLSVQNFVQPTANTIEFDVYLLDTDASQPFELASMQLGFLLNSAIYTGGTLSVSYNNTGSGLLASQQFSANPSIATNAAYAGQTLIRLAGKTPPGTGNGTIISTAGSGTLVTHFTITSSVPFTQNSTANLTFTSSTSATPLYATRVAEYINGTNTQLLVQAGVNAVVCCNPVLNPATTCEDPTLFTVTGGGSYCQGGAGVPVGLSGSQVGVNYTLNPGAVMVAGNGNPISFGNQLAGTYTVVALSNGTNPAICNDPVNMTGSADVIETPSSTVNYEASACDSYTWSVNNVTYTASGIYTFVDGCVTHVLNLTITPSSTVNFTEAACDSYTWALNGVTYTESGIYNYVVGCVTNVLNLTITESSVITYEADACDSYTWAYNNVTYTASGVYDVVDGCVTHRLFLTITESSVITYEAAACDSYTWAYNNVTYTASGVYDVVEGCVTHRLFLTITPSSTENFTASACDTYTWDLNGVTYTASGVYNYVVGCVTNVLNLTITPSSTVNFTEAACDSYTWSVNNVTYTASGIYTVVDGCVTYVLDLTITPSGNNVYTETACDSYYWAVSGQTYTASGVYTFVNGCSTNTLNLTIIESSIITYEAAACDSYTWAVNNVTYTASGVYDFVVGCVTHRLFLYITPSSTEEYTASACDEYFWAINGVTYTESGVYTYVAGCVTSVLNLTITESSTEEYTASACDSYSWAVNEVTYTESGVYTFVDGCVTSVLNLTITESSIVETTETAVDSYTWAVNGLTYTESGDYFFVDGCVTYVLHLTITTIPCPDFSTWNGSVSEDWFNEANWTPAVLPCETTSVTIPGGCPNYPTIIAPPTSSVACMVTIANLTILDGGSLIGQMNLCVTNDAVVERTIQNSNFHLISSPVDAVNFGQVFLPQYWFEVWAREYDEATGMWVNKTIADNLNVGQGYSVQMTTAPQTATFTGVLNGYDVTRTLSNVNPGTDLNYVGWNLIGNPFPSAIDWDAFSTGDYDAQVAVWDQSGAGNYIYWNGSVGSLTNGIIPAQNAFFVKTSVNGANITVPMFAQVHSPAVLFKSAVANSLELRANGNNYFDATYVHFNEAASANFDSRFDAFKLEGLETAPQLYSIAGGYNLSINELPFEGNEVVSLGFRCGVDGTYTINASGMDNFSSSTPILLEDLKLNTIQDLRVNPVYAFNYNTTDNDARFKLHFKAATGINDPVNNGIFVYSFERTVVINNTTGLNGQVQIFDMTGRQIAVNEMNNATVTRIPVSAAIGNYIVKVTTAQGTVNQKVFIK